MFSPISSLCIFVLTFSTSLAVRKDSVWTIRLTPSDAVGVNSYEGAVELLAVFTDGKQHSITLPSTAYTGNRDDTDPATFRVGMISPGPLQMVYVRTRGVCAMGLLPLNVLRLKQIELVSEDTNTTYNKFVDDLAIKDACQSNKSLGTTIKDFDEFNPTYCLVDGKKYTDGQQVDMGCIAKCTCMRGVLGCVDMCPTASWSPDRKCHFVHLPGQCCDAIRCEEDDAMNSCSSSVPKYDTDDTRQKGPTRRYPWSVLVCTDPKCSQVYGGTIVGSRHILMFSPDLSIFTDLRITTGEYIAPSVNGSDFSPLRVVNMTAHSDFVNPDSPIADSASRLQLLQLDQPLMFNTKTQAANLPWNKQQCAKLSEQDCSVMSVGWDRTDDQDELSSEIRQWFLHAEKSVLSNDDACSPNATSRHPRMIAPRRRGDRRVCLSGLARDDCTGPLGGAIVSTRGAVDFLVGLLDPDSALFSCQSQGIASVLPLCKYTEWVSSVITAGNF